MANLDPRQGSNIAHAILLNASSFFQKSKFKLLSLAVLASEYKSLSHQLISIKIQISQLKKLADQDLHCFQDNQNVLSERRYLK